MKFTGKELLIFDLDGTLIDSAQDLARSVNFMLQEIGEKPFSEALIHTWVGNGAQTLVKRALSGSTKVKEDIDKTLFDKALSIFLEHYKNNLCVKTMPYPGVMETLHKLHKDGHRLTIVTNKPFDFVAPILDTLGLAELFSFVLGGDSLAEKKPSPTPLLHLCNKFHIDVKNTLMIGDSKNDILAAQAAGMESIAVSYGYNYGEDIASYKPSMVVDEFVEILDLVE